MMDLQAYREQIDQLDADIVNILNQRAQIALQIGEMKAALGQSSYRDSGREQAVIERLCQHNDGPLSNDAIAMIYRTIMQACLDLQQEQSS